MDRRIRALALFLVACFALLVLQLNNIQIRQAPALTASPHDVRSVANPLYEPRGEIVTADGVVLARSVPTNDEYAEQRLYPEGSAYTDVTGYLNVVDDAAHGLESQYNSDLEEHTATTKNLDQTLTEQSGTDTVVTTINSVVQQAAVKALANFAAGAVVVIVPKTGAVLALYGKPTFDPNTLTSHNPAAVTKAFNALDPDSGSSPLINAATQQIYNPGSTFKVITTSAIYDHMPALLTTTWPAIPRTPLPETDKELQNYGGEVCGGDLAEIFAQSCDTAYTLIGIDLKAPNLASEASAFGFNQTPPIDLPGDEVSQPCFPPVEGQKNTNPNCPADITAIGDQNKPGIAYSAIGQVDVKESALEDAMVAAAIANGGKMMTPHLMSRIVDSTGEIVETYQPTKWKQSTSEDTATTLLGLMRGVVEHGTAVGVGFSPSEHVAAKTGTAETGTGNCSTDWLIATAPADPTDSPSVAVAAVVPYQAGQATTGCSETGAEVAGPVVKSVLSAALAAQ